MPVNQQSLKALVSGTHNLLPDEIIPKDAASASSNWLTKDGHIELIYGRRIIGAAGAVGKNYGEHTGYRVDGTAVRFRKVDSKIQYWSGTAWTDVITGLTVAADYTFANYQSLAGAFVYIFGVDGIYKIATANPASFTSLYDSAKNYKAHGMIDKGRTWIWNIAKDPTGLRGSWVDNQLAVSGATGVYTAVSGEATTSLTGTLAFKAGGATRTCFNVAITLTGTGEIYSDNYSGILTGSLGGTGTINYTSGAYTMSNSGVGTAAYQWENSNLRGVTDFSYSGTRLAGEGIVFRQDEGGDAIRTVLPFDGSYFSIKASSVYKFSMDATDLALTNLIFRTDIGVSTLRSATATGKGIVFINTANPSKPSLQILQRNPLGDNFDVSPLLPHFAFENYQYDDACLDFWDRYILVGCKKGTTNNSHLLLCDILRDTVDETYYGLRTMAKQGNILYGGDSVSQTTYELFTGFDDVGIAIMNNWDGNGESFGSDVLKKIKKRRIKGTISPAQTLQVYESYDDGNFVLIGTVLGNGDYVDYGASYAIGNSLVGTVNIGGGDAPAVYQFFIEIKVRALKFRKRKIRFVATGIGYVSINQITDFDIWTYQEKMPTRYRVKQNVSLSGTPVDMSNPNY